MARDTSPAAEERLRDADRSRSTILAAARDEFAESGLGGARVDRIAERAGLNSGYLMNDWPAAGDISCRRRTFSCNSPNSELTTRGKQRDMTSTRPRTPSPSCGSTPRRTSRASRRSPPRRTCWLLALVRATPAHSAAAEIRIRGWVEEQGFAGCSEVEIFSTGNWWLRPHEETLDTCIARHQRAV